MQVKVHVKNLRMSPQKVRIVADMIRGMDVVPALAQLDHELRAAALPVAKLLRSAIANAKHNHSLQKEHLYVESIYVDAGPTLKRYRPRAHGRASQILKRTSQIMLTLNERTAQDGAEVKDTQAEQKAS